MPAGARALYATMQGGLPVIYFLLHPDQPRVRRRVRSVATGEGFEAGGAQSVGLLTMADGALMFHVFVWPE